MYCTAYNFIMLNFVTQILFLHNTSGQNADIGPFHIHVYMDTEQSVKGVDIFDWFIQRSVKRYLLFVEGWGHKLHYFTTSLVIIHSHMVEALIMKYNISSTRSVIDIFGSSVCFISYHI